ncbi:MAG: PilN domain-containing protein [Candidatus Riflebacteria bacterium]|nr:PilN domain-containing protein [Candidatus Riflebacteria bacterium]
MKKCLTLLILAMYLMAGSAFAGPYNAGNIEEVKQVFAGTPLALTRLMLDLHLSYFERNAIRYMDVRISPMIRAEDHFEVPVEIGFMLTEDQIPSCLRGFEESSGGKMTSTPRSINVSVSAETLPVGKPLLSIMLFTSFHSNAGASYDNSLQKTFEAFSKVTTFSPQIKKASLMPQNKKDEKDITVSSDTWITNLRIDSDKRIQMTGYATDARLVNQLCRDLERTGAFSELWLSSMTRNIYEKQPVMRFDLFGKAAAEIPAEKN